MKLSWSTIVLIVSLSSRISPRTSTVIFFERSPFATAVVTLGDVACTCAGEVNTGHFEFTLSVRSFQVPAYPFHLGLTAEFPFRSHFTRHTRHFGSKRTELIHHRVDRVLQLGRISPLTSTVIFFDRSPFATPSSLGGDVAGPGR